MSNVWIDDARALERFLGDPRDEARPFGFAQSLDLDEREAFPEGPCALLNDWGYAKELVPAALGGRLGGFERLLALGRVVARRDLTVAIATGQTLLGALPVWIDGDDAQRTRVAERILSGGAGCLALTEEAHGSDLSAGEVHAERTTDGLTLSGTKWCVNNATRGAFATVLARTSAEGGPRGYSMLLVDKRELPGDAVAPIPRLRTHGIRGADISGMRFEKTPLAKSALVGREGHGLDLTFKALQVSRTMCTAFSLGAGDTALRLALDFTRARGLYGKTAYDIPVVRRTVADAFADLLVADAFARVACRALSMAPEQMSVVSSIAKYLVPTTVDAIIRECGVLLGARHYLREGPHAAFQKLARDHAVVSLFDGSTAVNLYVISTQLPRLAEGRLAAGETDDRLAAILGARTEPPPFDWRALKPSARGRDTLVAGLSSLVERVAGDGEIAPFAHQLDDAREALDREIAAHAASADYRQDDPRSFALARRYCLVAAAAAALGAWVERRDQLPASLAGGEWLEVALARVLAQLQPRCSAASAAAYEATSRAVESFHDESRLFSLAPFELGG